MFLFSLLNVTKTFSYKKNTLTAVKDISLYLPEQGLVSIVGKSGCGKSTLLNLLMGIEKPSKGTIYYQDKKLSKFSKRELSKYHSNDVSMIYQHYNLLDDLSVVENIALPLLIRGESKRKAHEEVRELLKTFGLEHLENQKVSTLSGGEKQRVAILRALITKPLAVLCDEPTGALDEKNSFLIMDELKKISRNKLVLMVSHNMNLVHQYSDRIIEMKDGKIIKDKLINRCGEGEKKKKVKTRARSRWIFSLVKQLFKKNKFKQFFSFISLMVGFLSIFIGVGFIYGSEDSQKHALERNLAIGCATVSETSYYSVSNSPLEFRKNVRPSSELIDQYLEDVDNIRICPNTNYFFSPYPNGYFNGEQIKQFEMVPLLEEFMQNNTIYPKIAGDFDKKNLTEVVVNKEFLKEISVAENDYEGKEILISYETSITLYTHDDDKPFVNDKFRYELKLRIVDVVEEFSFMNTPKIYYSYDALLDMLRSEILVNVSLYRERSVSILEYINEVKDDSPESSYSSFIFLSNLSDYEKLFRVIEETNAKNELLQIESKVYSIADSYKTFISSFKDALLFFLIIGFSGVLFILGMISLSNFLENKKQSAILTCLGARTRSISLIYLIYNFGITFLALIVGIGSSFILQNSLNSIICKKFGLTNLIAIPFDSFHGVKFGLIIASFLVAVLCTFLFTMLPVLAYKNFSISEELRDE